MITEQSLELGDVKVRGVEGGRMRLDGGTMFGVVPRVLWERQAPPDDRNRVDLRCHCLLVKSAGRNVLIDTGYGSTPTERDRENSDLEEGHPLLRGLAEAGLAPEAIDLVVLTHLHLDHAGGFTNRDRSGQLKPAFPNARYTVQRTEWEDATGGAGESMYAQVRDGCKVLADAGLVDLVDGQAEVAPGVSVRPSGGHTRGHQIVELGTGKSRALFLGDLCPTSAHLRKRWVMAFDTFPLTTRSAKPLMLAEAESRGWPVLFTHDPHLWGATLARDQKGEFIVRQGIPTLAFAPTRG